MIRIVFFREYDPFYKVDGSGFNKIGYILNNDIVIHPKLTRMTKSPLSRIRAKKHSILYLRESLGFNTEAVDSFFRKNIPNVELINSGYEALIKGDKDFFKHPVKIPILNGIHTEGFENRWQEFITRLRPGDLIMSVDTRSVFSRLITWVDQGCWSHTSCYVGEGKILEAVPAGVVERNLEIYHSPRFRLGIYRVDPEPTPEQVAMQLKFARSQIGKKYSYYGAVRLGIRKLFGNRWTRRGLNDFGPNDLAIFRGLRLEWLV